MIVTNGLKSQIVTPMIGNNISNGLVIDSDNSTSYGKLKNIIKDIISISGIILKLIKQSAI